MGIKTKNMLGKGIENLSELKNFLLKWQQEVEHIKKATYNTVDSLFSFRDFCKTLSFFFE